MKKNTCLPTWNLKIIISFIFLLILTLGSKQSYATTYYWIGGNNTSGSPGTFNTLANWNTTLGGGGSSATTFPGHTFIIDGKNVGSGVTGTTVFVNLSASLSTTTGPGQLLIQISSGGPASFAVQLGGAFTLSTGVSGTGASLTGDDISVASNCTLTIGNGTAATTLQLNISSNTTKNTLLVAGNLIIASASTFTNSQTSSAHIISGIIRVVGTFNNTSATTTTSVTGKLIVDANSASVTSAPSYGAGIGTLQYGNADAITYTVTANEWPANSTTNFPATVIVNTTGTITCSLLKSNSSLTITSGTFAATVGMHFANIIVGAGTTLTITNGFNFTVPGTVTNNGTFNPLTGTVNTPAIGDYRSLCFIGGGFSLWSSAADWQVRTAANTWVTASVPPTSASNCWIQFGHQMSLSGNAACGNLHMNSGGAVHCDVYQLSVSGKIREYTMASAITSAIDGGTLTTTSYVGANASGNPATQPWVYTTSSAGEIKFVGTTRSITFNNEWLGTFITTYPTAPNFPNFEFALDAANTATLYSPFRAVNIIVSNSSIVDIIGAVNVNSILNVATGSTISGAGLLGFGTGLAIVNSSTIYGGGTISIATLSLATATNVLGGQTTTFDASSSLTVNSTLVNITSTGTSFNAAVHNLGSLTYSGNGTFKINGSASSTGTAIFNNGSGSNNTASFTVTGSGTIPINVTASINTGAFINYGTLVTGGGAITVATPGLLSFLGPNQTIPSAVTVNTGAELRGQGSGSLTFPAAITINGHFNLGGSYSGFSGTPTITYLTTGTNTVNAVAYTGSVLQYSGTVAQNVSATREWQGVLNNVIINNALGVTMDHAASLATITLTSGTFTTTTANLITITGTTTTSVRRTSGYVSGPIEITLPNLLTSGVTYLLPVGKSTYKPFELVTPTTSGGTVVIRAEAFDNDVTGLGGVAGTGIATLNTNGYWQSSITSGAANFTSAKVQLTDAGRGSATVIGQSTALNGTYNSINGTVSTNTITSDLIPGSTYNPAYFALGVPFPNDAAIVAIPSPTAPVNGCSGSTTITATIYNYGTNVLNDVTVNWSVNPGGVQTPAVFTGLGLASGSSTTVTLGTFNFGSTGAIYSITARDTLPNNVADDNPSNDLFTRSNITTKLGGTITVGVGGNFTTLTSAVTALNTNNTCSAVTLSLTDANYNSGTGETFTINFTPATYSNTVTLKPAPGVQPLIEGASATFGLIGFVGNGAANVVIDGSNTINGTTKDLTISNTNATGPTIQIYPTSSTITGLIVKNCVIKGRNSTVVTGEAGVVALGHVGGGAAASCTIQNNDITGGSSNPLVGICLTNGSLTGGSNRITGNRIMNFTNTGIYDSRYSTLNVYSNNEIFQDASTTQSTALTGIWIASSANNLTIIGNKIHDLKTSASTTVYGIAFNNSLASANYYLINNMITITETSAAKTVAGLVQLSTSTSNSFNYFYNTVYIGGTFTGTAGTAGIPFSAALYLAGGSNSGAIVKNNILVNARSGGTVVGGFGGGNPGNEHYVICNTAINGGNGLNVTSDYNDLYRGSTSSNMFGYFWGDGTHGGGDYAYWDQWSISTGTGNDANSIHQGTTGTQNGLLPTFTGLSTGDLHLQPNANCGINGQGIVISSITKDIDSLTTGDTRSTGIKPNGPDIGADEFTNNFASAAGSNSPACAGGTLNLTASAGTSYSWSGPNGFISSLQNPSIANVTTAAAGTYTVTVANGSCSGTNTAAVIVSAPSASQVHTDITCNGGSNGSINLTASGTGPFTYQWLSDVSCASSSQCTFMGAGGVCVTGNCRGTNEDLNAIPAGNYSVVVTDNYGCTATASVVITAPPALITTAAGPVSPLCTGDTLNLSSSVTGGVTAYSYSWTGPNGFASTVANPSIPSTTPANSGTYSLTVTDAHNCTATGSATVTVNNCFTALNLHLIVEGYYVGSGQMNPAMFNEGVSGATTDQADTIMVELHDTIPPYALVEVVPAVLMTNDSATAIFSGGVTGGSYYIVIRHRNAVQTWSAAPVAFTTITSYSFVTAQSQAYGSNQVLIDVSPDRYALYNGDINQDLNIDLIDFPPLDFGINHGLFGYLAADLNGDGNVDLLDFPVLDANINAGVFSKHP